MPSPIATKHSRSRAAPLPRGTCTCGSLRKASRRVSHFYDTALAPVGIKSTQFSILAEIDRGTEAGNVTMAELAQAMVMDRSTLGHNLKPLERDKLLLLRCDDGDRRKRHVELTQRGRDTLRRARRLWGKAESHFETIFGRTQAAELRSVLLSIAGNAKLDAIDLV